MRMDLSGIVPGRFFSVIQVNFLPHNSRAGADNNNVREGGTIFADFFLAERDACL
jgi:hypothetical protein